MKQSSKPNIFEPPRLLGFADAAQPTVLTAVTAIALLGETPGEADDLGRQHVELLLDPGVGA